jgi:hypothetical protein
MSSTPGDLWVAKVGQLFAFYLGKLDEMTKIGRIAVKEHQDNHYVYGMLAFALEEVCSRELKPTYPSKER